MQSTDTYNVYVVDPDTAIRDSVELLLDSTYVDVYGFEDSESFLEQAALDASGCLLVENLLPDANGLSLISQVRDMGNDIPALLLTSSTDPSLAARAAEIGVTGIIRKPLHSEQLMDQINIMRHPRRTR